MKSSRTYIATPPGATVKEQLQYRKMSQKEFAKRMDMSEKHISKFLNGDVALTPDMASRLELVLGLPAHFWNNLESIYREKLQLIKRDELTKMFDHTLLKPYVSSKEMEEFCIEAKSLNPMMVAINSAQVKLCKEMLKDTDIHVGAAISFPLGQTTIDVKKYETEKSILDGADEIDYVINITKLKDKDYDYIEEEMKEIVTICKKHNVISKVIFENCYLTKDEIIILCNIAKKVKPDYIKTSTGFGTNGARKEDVELMKSIVGDTVKIKAAGGIRDWNTCKEMIDAGASRIGTSSSFKILESMKKKGSKTF